MDEWFNILNHKLQEVLDFIQEVVPDLVEIKN